MPTKLSQDSLMERERAKEQLDYIMQLESSHAFQRYFMARLQGKIADKAAELLSPNMTEDRFPTVQSAYLALLEVSRILEEDAAGCRNTLGLEKNERPCM